MSNNKTWKVSVPIRYRKKVKQIALDNDITIADLLTSIIEKALHYYEEVGGVYEK